MITIKQIDDIGKAIEYSRLLREKLLSDPTRPGYHFAIPEDIGIPGDPNGAFFANGRYHLMYLYACRSDSFRWGHISSTDLVHWRSHPDALIPDELDGGIFSGGAFVDDDGVCYLTYWALPVEGKNSGGIRIARSTGPLYEKWEKFAEFALPCTESGVYETKDSDGNPLYLGCADPSNIWKKDGVYYLQTGNLSVLLKFKRDGIRDYSKETEPTHAPDNIKGDWVDLFKSRDLVNWGYVHRFYKRNETNIWTAENEDDMCPSFLPLPRSKDGGEASGKYLQLFIAHNRGCQYYIGAYDKENDLFIPEKHGRMSWIDNTYFAPEALIDPRGRQIMWSWLLDNTEHELEKGWSGVYGLPRVLWLGEDDTLRMAPAPELETLRYNPRRFGDAVLNGNKSPLNVSNGTSCEINFTATLGGGAEAGLYVRAAEDFSEYTKIYYESKSGILVFDSLKSGAEGRKAVESAPLHLAPDEELRLRVFIDKSVIEVYANDRQAICRRVYPACKSDGVYLYAAGDVVFKDVETYEMMPSNFC